MWDIGGQRKIRPYWKNYFERTDVLVCIIDIIVVIHVDINAVIDINAGIDFNAGMLLVVIVSYIYDCWVMMSSKYQSVCRSIGNCPTL